MASRQVYTDIEPIRTGFNSVIKIKYSDAFWTAYNMGTGGYGVSVRDDVDSTTELWQGDTISGEVVVDTVNKIIQITIPAATTLNWRGKEYVTFDLLRFVSSNKFAIPGIWKWPVVSRSTTAIPT